MWAVSFIPFKTACRKPQVPRGLPQSFRDHSHSFRECFLKNCFRELPQYHCFDISCNIASANTARASAKHVGIEFVDFEVRYEHRWFTEKHYYFRSKSFRHICESREGSVVLQISKKSHIWHVANTFDKDPTPSAELPQSFPMKWTFPLTCNSCISWKKDL